MNRKALIGHVDRLVGRTATAVAAATGVGLVGQAQEAHAQIVYSGPVNIAIPATTAGVYLNFVTGVNGPVPGNVPGWDVNPYSSGTLTMFNPAAPAGGVYVVNYPGGTSATAPDNLPFGTLISAASGFGSGVVETTGISAFTLNSDNNYVGIRFQNEANANATNYGWFQVHLGADYINGRTIIGYAYEASGVGILSGATGVPEPTSLALLSLGAGGLATFRRYRRKKA